MRQPGGRPLLRRRVLLVVAGQVQLAQVDERIAPVQLELAELDPAEVLERGQVRLVVPVAVPGAPGGPRLVQPGQPGADAVR